MTTKADEYFEPVYYAKVAPVLIQHQGTYLVGGDGSWDRPGYAYPLFDAIEGISPGGTDYKALGCSRHSQNIQEIADRFLSE